MENTNQLAKILRSAVDYLTVTTKTEASTATLLHTLFSLLPNGWVHAEVHKPWRFMGYSGTAFDGIRYGLRGEEGIVMVSGARASEVWAGVAPYRQKCTRIDLQVTCELGRQNTEVASEAYQTALEDSGRTSSLVTSSRGGRTCYIGSRQSQFFGRIYDKGAEEGLDPGWIWRYEVECKKPASEAVISRLLEQDSPSEWIVSYIHQWFTTRSIVPLFASTDRECAIEIGTIVTTKEKQLEWLRTQVRPTVGRLCVLGLEFEVRDALGLPTETIDFASLQQEVENGIG